VGEPTVEDTIGILRGLKGRYEAHHRVQITDAALVAAAALSDRYISDRFLPDKAIDLIDEAASRLRMEIDSRPVELDQLQRVVDRMRMDEMALANEKDEASQARLARLRAELADKQEELTALNARWERERSGLNRVGELKKKIDEAKAQLEIAWRDGNLDEAGRLMNAVIPALEKELETASVVEEETAEPPMVKEEVGADAWRSHCPLRWSASGRRSKRSPAPCAAPGPASPTRTGRPAASCSSDRPASARPSWPRHWPGSSSMTSARWCAST
jgi:ATP-dependent Clp protease ATP-binding subunit ClpB